MSEEANSLAPLSKLHENVQYRKKKMQERNDNTERYKSHGPPNPLAVRRLSDGFSSVALQGPSLESSLAKLGLTFSAINGPSFNNFENLRLASMTKAYLHSNSQLSES
jgi:hypothetical protein